MLFRRKFITVSFAILVLGGTITPSSVSAVNNGYQTYNTEYSTEQDTYYDYDNDYGTGYDTYDTYGEESDSYYDEYDDSDVYEESATYVTKDTSWFDSDNPKKEYTINNEAELLGFASLVYQEQTDRWKEDVYEDFEGTTFTLTADIELSENWVPVGDSEDVCFKGIFDGNGHTISGLNIADNGSYTGFFGYLDGQVLNLTLEGKITSTGSVCGSFAGYMSENAMIAGCTSKVDISAKSKTGGIAGYNDEGIIYKCINSGNISGTMKVGGVVGENWGQVRRCGNSGNIRSSLRGATTYGTGGVAGRSVCPVSVISKCYNTGNIVSHTEGTGGVVGYTNASGASILNSYNTGDIKVINPTNISREIFGFAGGVVGIVGIKGVIIQNCYSSGIIENGDYTGGIIGRYQNDSEFGDDSEPYISNNYYANNNSAKGIAYDCNGDAVTITRGTKQLSGSSLKTEAGVLGAAYEDDLGNSYGSGGYPILKWQSGNTSVEKDYLSNISVSKQNKFDKFLDKNPVNKWKGSSVRMMLNPFDFISKTLEKKEDNPKDYLSKVRKDNADTTVKSENHLDNSSQVKKNNSADSKNKAVIDVITPLKSKIGNFEKEHPINHRKGWSVLRYFNFDTYIDKFNDSQK